MEAEHIGPFLRSRPAQRSTHPAEELHDAERLGNVVVGTAVQPAHGVQLAGFGRDHDDGQPVQGRGVAQLFQDGEPILAGQHHVQDHKLRGFGAHGLPERFRTGKAGHFITVGLQGILLQLTDGVIIFYDIDHLSNSSAD